MVCHTITMVCDQGQGPTTWRMAMMALLGRGHDLSHDHVGFVWSVKDNVFNRTHIDRDGVVWSRTGSAAWHMIVMVFDQGQGLTTWPRIWSVKWHMTVMVMCDQAHSLSPDSDGVVWSKTRSVTWPCWCCVIKHIVCYLTMMVLCDQAHSLTSDHDGVVWSST